MIGLASVGAVLLIGCVGVVAYRSLDSLLRAFEWEVHTEVVLVGFERENGLLREAESARRGFVLTSDEGRAEEFQRAAEGARRTLMEVRQLTSDNPRQQRRLAAFAPLVEQRLTLLDESIQRHRRDPKKLDAQAATTREGIAVTERLRRLLDEMILEENALFTERHAKALQGASESGRFILFSSALAILALIGAAVLLLRTGAARHEAETTLANERALLQSVVEGMGDGLISADQSGHFVIFNPAAERILGAGKVATTAETWTRNYRLFRADATTPFPEEELPLARALRGESSDAVEMHIARPDRGVWISVSARPLRDLTGAVTGGFSVFTDITERRRAAAEIEAVNARLQRTVSDLSRLTAEKTMLAELGDTLHGCQSLEEAYDAVARTATDLFPVAKGELFAVDPSRTHMLRKAVWGNEPESSVELMFEPDDCWAARRGNVHLSFGEKGGLCGHVRLPDINRHVCVPLMSQEGTIGVLHLELGNSAESGVETTFNPDERVRTATATANLIASALTSLRLRDKLRTQSIRDPLTGLFNRRYMEESLLREIRRAERNARPIGVIMLDVDHFKRANDEYGHAAGDSVLRELGILLASHIRSSDFGCRYGGEEFALVLPEANIEETFLRAEAIRVAVATHETHLPNGALVKVTVSQGMAAFPQHGATPDELLHAADGALYVAKRGGRNRVERAPARVIAT